MDFKKCILALEDGKVFEGFSCGADTESTGEIVFNTAVFGYQEIVTDPATAKQLICFAHPHVGDCGFNNQDFQSGAIQATGLFLRNIAEDIPIGEQTFQCRTKLLKTMSLLWKDLIREL